MPTSPADHPRAWSVAATASTPGAIAIIQIIPVHGQAAVDVESILAALTGIACWPVGRLRLVTFDDIDDGLAARLAPDLAEIMPHGGPRVVQRLLARLATLGAPVCEPRATPPTALYPEARDAVEALMLATLARARSPHATDLLLDQPRRWREHAGKALAAEDISRSRRLDRLVDPPIVVVAGPSNVGKSTLSNVLLGRSLSITRDEPGTTRDYTAGLLALGPLVVRWHDTPGLRATTDPIERRAIELARGVITRSELLIAMTDADHPWPELPRQADLRLGGRSDLGRRDDADLSVSAVTGEGLEALTTTLRKRLVPTADLDHPGRWCFDERLIDATGCPGS